MPLYSAGGSAASAAEILAITTYNPGTDTNITTTSTTLVDVSATNLVVTFTAPASGKVVVLLNAVCSQGTGSLTWSLREGTTQVGTDHFVCDGGNFQRRTAHIRISGLTPGQSYTWKWAAKTVGGTASVARQGGGFGGSVMTVLAA